MRGGFIYSIIRFFLDLVTSFVEIILMLRFILRLFAANPSAPIVNWIYETSRSLLTPFLGIFPSPRLEPGSVLEFTTLFAMIIYAIIYMAIIALIDFLWSLPSSYGRDGDNE